VYGLVWVNVRGIIHVKSRNVKGNRSPRKPAGFDRSSE
jgi:hypothetical protein